MSEETDTEEGAAKKASKLPLLAGVFLALAGGGGAFYAIDSGLILAPESQDTAPGEQKAEPEEQAPYDLPDVAYVPVTPLVISLGDGATGRHLRFNAQLEVGTPYRDEVAGLMPRVVDVLNGYLRALDVEDLTDKTALMRLRAQMLRRVQIVAGGERIKDLLIMEFVLN